MPAVAEAPEFTPPPEGSLGRSLAFAVIAHLVLVMALSIGVQWKRDDDKIAVEAELWAPTPQQAAPKPVEAPPPPPPPPPVEKPVVQPPPAPPQRSDAEIALERERQQAAEAAKKREEEAERQRKLAERKRQEELEKQQQAKKAADEQRRREEQAKAKQEEQAKQKREEQAKARREKQEEERLAKIREENIKRIQGMANATGSATSTGSALQSAGPSASYGGRVRAKVKPNIVFTDLVSGNPSAEVDVRLAPDGTVVGRSLRKSSGVASWDEAVLRAIDRTEVFPRDVDGRVPSAMTLVFRPKD
ncbi:cell envelope integrity protein TolA [Ramlibacter sp. MMS24-I3-19]|uniref:cell envelope integrity protein TolA n=1 Tax=Ramlibacter sp. MMS24-I3-19 TaxID=3416606 RepID=UPI003D03CA53